MSAKKKSRSADIPVGVAPWESKRPVITFGSTLVIEEMRVKARAFDLLKAGGYISTKKADQALELARTLK